MIEVLDLERGDYSAVLDMQRKIFSGMVETKKRGETPEVERLLLVEHQPVITLGRHAHEENLLVDEERLRAEGIEVVRIERGGDITYHGPGQLVAYPLIDLERHHMGVKSYVEFLEEVVIRTLSAYGIKGERVDGATGVWIGKGTPGERKICAIGVKCSRHCTMHGLALNVNTDLSHFRLINPCGFIDKGVTSMAAELGKELDIDEVKKVFSSKFLELLG